MRPILFANVVLGFYIFHLQFRGTQQWFKPEYPWYHNMTFDMVQRGTMNMSSCNREMLNCWEIMRPEYVCYKDKDFESLCGVLRNECSDDKGPLDLFGSLLEVYENTCMYWQYHTRRFFVLAFGPELGEDLHEIINGTIFNRRFNDDL